VPELSRWQKIDDPLLEIPNGAVEPRRNDSTLVNPTGELDYDLARPVVVHNFELPDVPVLLHRLEEFDDNLGRGTDENLTLTTLLSVCHGFEAISQHRHADHLWEGGQRGGI